MDNYLKSLTDYFYGDQKGCIANFSNEVSIDLQKSKTEFEKDQITFDIEPVVVKEKTVENDAYKIVTYTGTFIYGFLKNGTFHVVPGDLSTATERKQNESGQITFYVNKTTNKIDSISESFAGNIWGKEQNKKILPNFQKTPLTPQYIIVVIIIVVVLGTLVRGILQASQVIQ